LTASTALATGTVRWSIDAPPGTDVRVTFTPSVPLVHAAAPDPRTVVLDREQLTGRRVTLNATDDPDVTPTGWTWVAHLRLDGQLVASFPFDLPSGADLDLAELAPVPESRGVTIVRGPVGDTGPAGPQGATRSTRAQGRHRGHRARRPGRTQGRHRPDRPGRICHAAHPAGELPRPRPGDAQQRHHRRRAADQHGDERPAR
jgi:hypothetical protein